jgi:hypothetical protein
VIQRSGDSNAVSAKGSMFISDSDRLLVTRNSEDGEEAGVVLVSDGKHIRRLGTDALRGTPKGIGQLSRLVFSRGGFDLAFEWTRFDAPFLGWASKLNEWSQSSDVQVGAAETIAESQAMPFSYRLHIRDATPDSLDVTVWIDVASRLPRRRVIVYPDHTITEEYTRVAVDEPLDNKHFQVK